MQAPQQDVASSSTAPQQSETAREAYQRLMQEAENENASLAQTMTKLVWLRMALFLSTAFCLGFGYFSSGAPPLLRYGGWVLAFGFLVAILFHEHFRLRLLACIARQQLYRELIARLDRNWEQVPETELLLEYRDMHVADDLDVAGGASLLGLISLAVTLPGRRCLQSWLAEVPSWDDVRGRQSAVQRILPEREMRLKLVGELRAASDGSEDVYGLPTWARSPDWRTEHRGAMLLSYLGPACVALGLAGLVVAVAAFDGEAKRSAMNVAAGFVAAGFGINILLTILWGSWLHGIFQQITGSHKAVYGFASVFKILGELPRDEPMLGEIRDAADGPNNSALRGFSKLLGLVRLANLQRDPLMYVVYLALQLTVAWDFRVIRWLENWKRAYGPHVEHWFASLGRFEALCSLATLADGHPGWTFPQEQKSEHVLIDAIELGHPLLEDANCVRNNLELEASRPLLLVTGSNMAGKSTFMRALGLNMLLGRTGAPVCAETLAMPQFDLATSIRVRDSLKEGVSFFMAELNRLKEVVDHAEHVKESESAPVFFLLDEILQGTNSQERQIAVANVLTRLKRLGAIGVLSTHDLDLANESELVEFSQIVHFREFFETVDGVENMCFDYIMRPGPTPTTNALKLLNLVGLANNH